jgi:DNA repair ATPase RecN
MANSVTQTGSVINIASIDSDYDLGEALPIHSISFIPGSAADEAVFKHGSDTAAICAYFMISSKDEATRYFHGQRLHLYLDFSASTISAGGQIVIILQRHRTQ